MRLGLPGLDGAGDRVEEHARCRAGPAGSRCGPPRGSRPDPGARRRGCCPRCRRRTPRRGSSSATVPSSVLGEVARPRGTSSPEPRRHPLAARSGPVPRAAPGRPARAPPWRAPRGPLPRVPPGDSGLRSSFGSTAIACARPSTSGMRSTTSNLCRLRNGASTPSSASARSAAKNPDRSPAYPKPTRTSPVSRPRVRNRRSRVVAQRDADQPERHDDGGVEHEERRRDQPLPGLEVDAGEVGDPVRLPHQGAGHVGRDRGDRGVLDVVEERHAVAAEQQQREPPPRGGERREQASTSPAAASGAGRGRGSG